MANKYLHVANTGPVGKIILIGLKRVGGRMWTLTQGIVDNTPAEMEAAEIYLVESPELECDLIFTVEPESECFFQIRHGVLRLLPSIYSRTPTDQVIDCEPPGPRESQGNAVDRWGFYVMCECGDGWRSCHPGQAGTCCF